MASEEPRKQGLEDRLSDMCSWLRVEQKRRIENPFWALRHDLRGNRIGDFPSHNLLKELAGYSDGVGLILRNIKDAMSDGKNPENLTELVDILEEGRPKFTMYSKVIKQNPNKVDSDDLRRISDVWNEFTEKFKPLLSELDNLRKERGT